MNGSRSFLVRSNSQVPGGLKFRFTGSGWSGTAPNGYNWDTKPTLVNRALDWEDEYEYNASSRVVDLTNTSGEIDIYFVAQSVLTGTNPIADASCNNKRIRVADIHKPPAVGPSTTWYDNMAPVIQHELGHTMGHRHTGRYDSHDSRRPVMATCQSFSNSSLRSLSQDDWESHQRINGALNPETMTANVGFNRGTSYYAKNGGSYWYMSGSTLRWRRGSPSSDQKFYQTTAVAGSAGKSYDVRINWARPFSGLDAGVWASMYARPVSYASDSCGAVPGAVSGHSLTGARSPGSVWYFKGDVGQSVPATPTSLTHMDTTIGSMTGNTVDIQLRVASNAADTSGNSQYMTFDNVRIRER